MNGWKELPLKIVNVHQRLLYATPERAGRLIDSLSSTSDLLWPRGWPRLSLDRPLRVGAAGGHGPIRYLVESYVPGQAVRFRFTGPRGFHGWHAFEVVEATAAHCVLEHRIEMTARGAALWSWRLLYRPLHDALIEDALSLAQASLGNERRDVPWSRWVKVLRWLLARCDGRPARPITGEPHAN
jgi:hypothetical protein